MKTKLFCMLFLCCCIVACGHKKELGTSGTASVLSSSGRTSCEWVQLWENGPRWATFNVGATITDYANLTAGIDSVNGNIAECNTANIGGLYPWNNPNLNGHKTTWSSSVSTGISDVATSLWGSNWKTPTKEQLDTLCDYENEYGITTWTWCDGSTTQYVKGCTLVGFRVTGVGNYAQYSIFLPTAGYYSSEDYSVYYSGYSYYWSSTESDSYNASYLGTSFGRRGIFNGERELGQSVRAILAE